VKPFLSAAFLVFAAAASAAVASEGAAGQPAGIPWGDILKQTVNFAILTGALVYFLRKPLSSFLKERSEMLRKSIDDAARAREEAAAKLSAIETRMARLSDEVAGMNRKMDAEAKEEAHRFRDAAQAEIERIRIQTQVAADQEVKKARLELRREAAALATSAAEEIVRKTMTPEDRERLVRENIEKIGEVVR
jgi:F-type H+-transporting ATPase subunit b